MNSPSISDPVTLHLEYPPPILREPGYSDTMPVLQAVIIWLPWQEEKKFATKIIVVKATYNLVVTIQAIVILLVSVYGLP